MNATVAICVTGKGLKTPDLRDDPRHSLSLGSASDWALADLKAYPRQ